MGLKLDSTVEPVPRGEGYRDLLKGEKAEFTVEWNQGEMHIGAFKPW